MASYNKLLLQSERWRQLLLDEALTCLFSSSVVAGHSLTT